MKKRIIVTSLVCLAAFIVPKISVAKWCYSLEGEAVYNTKVDIDLKVLNISVIKAASVEHNLLGFKYDCEWEWFSTCDSDKEGFKAYEGKDITPS